MNRSIVVAGRLAILAAAVAVLLVAPVDGRAERLKEIASIQGVRTNQLLGYGLMWPNNRVFLIFLPIPVKAKWFVLLYGLAELLFGLTGTAPGVAHFAHLGGMLFGAALLWKWGWRPGYSWQGR